jgi:hypothetical protein
MAHWLKAAASQCALTAQQRQIEQSVEAILANTGATRPISLQWSGKWPW